MSQVSSPLYMDSHATCPPSEPVIAAMVAAARAGSANPSSTHARGQEARRFLEHARAIVAETAGARPDQVIFTSGATEANTTLLEAMVAAGRARLGDGVMPRVVTTNIEHSSVREVLRRMATEGRAEVVEVPVGPSGIVDPAAVAHYAADPRTVLVTVMSANNEIGTLQPIAEIARRLPPGLPFHTDAAQSFGKVELPAPFNAGPLVTVSGHKVGGLIGTGAMLIPDRFRPFVRPLLVGGTHEAGLRAGTENVVGAVTFATALHGMRGTWPLHTARDEGDRARVRYLRDLLLAELQARLPGRVTVNGAIDAPGVPRATLRLPQNLNVSIAEVCPDLLHRSIGDRICVSAAAACKKLGKQASHVLQAIGADPSGASVRFGLMASHDEVCVRYAAQVIAEAALRLRGVGCGPKAAIGLG